ncbi:unnamed protein product [Cylindrotheca closterium]|uniref:Alpha 1,4-glycosyltransferase domain-containing protein n=1 Tax=Cylindrotheca closterium TaxID=2856 RepID=A0AAD2G7P4_9STRA|nr:unnamed protein product [Cylindrotheca closterium]
MSKDASLAKRKSRIFPKSLQAFACCLLLAFVIDVRGWVIIPQLICDDKVGIEFPNALKRRQLRADDSSATITVFVSNADSYNAKKLKQDLRRSALVTTIVDLDANPPSSLPNFALPYCKKAQSRYMELHTTYPYLAVELIKYCALAQNDGGLIIDADSPILTTLEDLLGEGLHNNVALLNDEYAPQAIHGAFLYLKDGTIAKQMVNLLTKTTLEELKASHILLITKGLYDSIAADTKVSALTSGIMSSDWYLFQHKCTINPVRGGQIADSVVLSYNISNSYSLNQNCPEGNGFCCSIIDPKTESTVMITKHLIFPHQTPPHSKSLAKPLHAETGSYKEDDLPYISTISEKLLQRPQQTLITPNFFDILLQNDCLPNDKRCMDCMKNRMGGNCRACKSFCQCYCKALCRTPIPQKFISKELSIRPPQYARDPSRLIPKIVHQTWLEDVTPEDYPNMSRLIESFKQSGWTYVFYTDRDIENFLSTHFPLEVRQAYDALRPGSFKADLFRYCVLLIYGGVYADMDILLETNLDLAIESDIGFMVPEDEPADSVGQHKMCLWNGLIASAPGHLFMAKAIESVVNNVRNRFTIVDIDATFCPKPELSILREVDTLFLTGPCLLGAMVNKVLGRHGQASFKAGELDLLEVRKEISLAKKQNVGVQKIDSQRFPGRTIILDQGKRDMGAHRFTFLEKNLVVAATDLPGSDDRGGQKKPAKHYSNTHVDIGIYGLERLYTDNVRANEEIRFAVES